MYYENPRPVYPNELYHYGIMGMHWGIRRYQPYRKGEKAKGGEKVKSGHFIGQAIAKNRTTRDSYLSSFLAADYRKRVDKLHEETERRKEKRDRLKGIDGVSNRKYVRRERRYRKALATEKDNEARANFWKNQAEEDIRLANKVNEQFAHDHPHSLRRAPAKTVESGADRYIREHTHSDQNGGTYVPNAPYWNWQRGWGHQWAVEKTKGFDSKENRNFYKKVLKKNLKDEKKTLDMYDKREKILNKLDSGKINDNEEVEKLATKASDLSQGIHEIMDNARKRSGEYQSRAAVRKMLDPVRNPKRVEYQNYMNRTRQANENVGYSPKMRDRIDRHREEYNRIRNSGFDVNINSGEITVSNGSRARKAYYKEALKAGVPSDVAKGIAKRVTNQQLLALASEPDRVRSSLKDLAREAKNSNS